MHQATLGMMLQHPSRLSHEVAQELLNLADPNADFDTIIGKTMCTLDFYEGWHFVISSEQKLFYSARQILKLVSF